MSTPPLSAEERSELIARARRAGAAALGLPVSGPAPSEPSGRLADPGMCFVTWTRTGRLRGCIGSLEPVRPLWADVEANAVHALLRDPRFPPATPREFPAYRVEISVLSPFTVAEDPTKLEIGVHGLLIEKGRRRGLLLPQVAVQWGWDVATFLQQVCLKAGLPETAWSDDSVPPATVSTFTAEVFGEPLS
ncbi:MAG TPA: AmmeMemoRadiSam system protein A [Thermoanaerobaculia bacterium]|nr:AmmeMemoRadiSam system protein A [Thermoanaerobaculia bacterium]HQR67300.1 AmmeMemoRadiSam system protein A [Thermoanaerobaculia bacterium]